MKDTRITSQPKYDTQEQAISAALELIERKQDYPEVWQEPDGGKYIVANYIAWEAMHRAGYKKIASASQLAEMREVEEIEEV